MTMELLFSEMGRKRLGEVARPGLLCAFDFDGTLAPIVPTPEEAHLPDGIRDRLLALAQHAPVAIITGRSIEDISTRLGFEPDFVVGNHGLEGVPGWEAESARHRDMCSAWFGQLQEALATALPDPGIQVENKRYSLSVHYRQARDPDDAASRLESLFSRLSPHPRVVGGKYVFNLLAEDTCNKGTALDKLMQVCAARSAVYVGDDVTDEDVFRLRRDDVLSIRIEHHAQSAAGFYVPQHGDIVQFLDDLTAQLRANGAKNWLQPAAVRRA